LLLLTHVTPQKRWDSNVSDNLQSQKFLATVTPYSYDKTFKPILREQMEYYNSPDNRSNTGNDKIAKIKSQIEDIKEQMIDNIDNVLDRGERLELLVSRTQDLQEESVKFRTATRNVRNQSWWSRMKLMIVIFAVVAATLGVRLLFEIVFVVVTM